jgi:prepilin-type N-terminal cleavage/methylation domain-containing protein
VKVDNRSVSNYFKRFLIFNFQFHLQKGQTLIETLAALAILSILIVGIATSVISSLSNAEFNDNQTTATKYAQQGLEYVTQIRDQSYASFKGYSGTYCLGQNPTSLGTAQASCTTRNYGNFIRSVVIQQAPGCAANVASVIVAVSFTDGKCSGGSYCHTESESSCLSTTNPIQAP